MKSTLIAGFLVLTAAVAGVGAGHITKYKVVSTADKHTDFTKLKTYAWETGWTSYDQTVHQQIVAAVDRELAALGLTKVAEGKSDVTVVYGTIRRTDVDLKSKMRGPEGERPVYPVATLVVQIRHPETHKELFRARADTPIQLEGGLETIINDQVAQMFERYPTRHSDHH